MRTVAMTKAKATLPRLVKQVENSASKIYITKRGRNAAVLMSVGAYESLKETLDVLSDTKMVRQIRDSLKPDKKARRYALDELFKDEK